MIWYGMVWYDMVWYMIYREKVARVAESVEFYYT